MKHSPVKEAMIQAATQLIEQSSGNIAEITTRAIAEKAGVGIGLINYHFQSKDYLITLCVQRIISQVIARFAADAPAYQDDQERLTGWAIYVFDFLFEHPAISRISILGDMADYSTDSNSAKTQKGFMMALGQNVPDSDKPLLSFILTSAMQTAFLSRHVSKELLGYDFQNSTDRSAFIKSLVTALFEGN